MGPMVERAMQDLRSRRFWAQCFAEFFGTMLLVYGIEATSNYNVHERRLATINKDSIVQHPVQRGIIIGGIVLALHRFFGPTSGGYFNPAVTLAGYFSGDICTLRGSMYAGVQYLGGMLGAGLHYLLTPAEDRDFGTELDPSINVARGFFIEFMLSFLLTIVYLSRDSKYGKKNYAESAVTIGLTYIALNAIGEIYTGASINPARALAVPIITGVWPKSAYIYYLSPYFGASLAGGFYRIFYERIVFGEEKKQVTVDVEAQS